MKINTALILCAGLGKRLNPLTLTTPKPLLELDSITILERCINVIIESGAKKIFLNTFHLSSQIFEYIKNKKFQIDIQITEDGKEILDTGGGILNMVENSEENDFIIFNPDTLWHKNYIDEISKMQDFYFSKKLNNILLLVNKELSFDKNLKGDFKLCNNKITKSISNEYIYTGCQIINKSLFLSINKKNFSILELWNKLIEKDNLFGFEVKRKFYHITNLEIYNKLLKSY